MDKAYCAWGWMILSITLVLSSIACFFGLLALPGGRNDQGGFKEERIRLSVAGTLMVAYLVLFSTAIFFGNRDQSINLTMMDTLTQLMMVVLPFYFGTSGLVEWAKLKERKAN